jgi:hypothetical protein
VVPWSVALALFNEGFKRLLDYGLELTAIILGNTTNFSKERDVNLSGKR